MKSALVLLVVMCSMCTTSSWGQSLGTAATATTTATTATSTTTSTTTSAPSTATANAADPGAGSDASTPVLASTGGAHNVIHIVIDDLRTEVGAYTTTHDIFTPAMDRIAARGVTFDRAYAQQALCNPSRASFMTGRRPDTTQIWNLNDNWRVKHQLWTSLPGQFLAAGMLSLGAGKTYHDTVQNGLKDGVFEYDHARSWSPEALPYRNPCWTQGIDCSGCPRRKKGHDDEVGWDIEVLGATDESEAEEETSMARKLSPERWSIGNVTEDWCVWDTGDLSDVLTTDHAIGLLQTGVDSGKAFYLAVGYHKPHLPWIAKQEFFDLYPIENITLAKVKTLDDSIPPIAYNDNDSESPWEPLDDYSARIARRAYYAATSGMDHEIGRLLDALDESGVADNTAILLHSDHGWQLGERAGWRKNTNWENGVRVPFMVAVPWMPQTAGTRTDHFAELVDVMPTLAELAGIPTPSTKLGDRLDPVEGVSLVPALGGSEVVKTAAFSQYPRKPKDLDVPWQNNGIDHSDPSKFEYMGYSVRVDEWRYTEWYPWNGETLEANWTSIYASELYDWRGSDNTNMDYDLFENTNLANSRGYEVVLLELKALLRRQFKPRGL